MLAQQSASINKLRVYKISFSSSFRLLGFGIVILLNVGNVFVSYFSQGKVVRPKEINNKTQHTYK